MKKLSSTMLIACIAITGFFSSCTKSNDNNTNGQSTVKKEYRLFNESTGMPLDAGTFTISQLADGNASLTIHLAAGYRVSNINFQSHILTADATGTELMYAKLSQIDGNTGIGVTSPVMVAGNNQPIKYADLTAKTNYVVEVLNGGKVQARGIIN